MRSFKEEQELLFTQMLHYIDTLGENAVSVTETDEIYLNKTKLVYGSSTINDDILPFCSNLHAILVYLECIYKVFLKYLVSFRLNKYDFLETWVEYVGHDFIKAGNCPAQSKFYFINNCILPPTGQSLFSFVGLVNLYHRYAHYFEIKLKPLQKFLKQYYRKPIPMMAWTPQLITLFSELKHGGTSSQVLARFDTDKPTFLQIYWSSEGIGWIMMQPANDKESQHASTFLKDTGTCLFDLSPCGAWLQPISFDSRSCNYF